MVVAVQSIPGAEQGWELGERSRPPWLSMEDSDERVDAYAQTLTLNVYVRLKRVSASFSLE
jgi:hypothetical protein